MSKRKYSAEASKANGEMTYDQLSSESQSVLRALSSRAINRSLSKKYYQVPQEIAAVLGAAGVQLEVESDMNVRMGCVLVPVHEMLTSVERHVSSIEFTRSLDVVGKIISQAGDSTALRHIQSYP